MYSTLYVHYSAGCAITSLCLQSGLSERVSYSDYAIGCSIRDLDPSRDMQIFLFSEMSRQAVGPPSLLFKGYRDSSLGVKWPGHGAVPLLPQLCLHGMDKTTFLNT